MASDISKAIQLLCDEKGLSHEIVMEALEAALAAAYRKDFGNRQQNIKMKFDPETGDMKAWDVKTVVEDIDEAELEKAQEELTARREAAHAQNRELTEEEVADLVHFNPKTELMLTAAKEASKKAKVGEVLEIPLEIPSDFGRMAAQTAKQVIIQKIREAERSSVMEEFKGQQGQIVQAIVQRRDKSGAILIDLGKITGILPMAEQVRREQYRPGARFKFYVVSVGEGMRGPEIILSRTRNDMVGTVFSQEIPEIANGSVVIKGIARDPGNRSKVAVFTDDDSIDPIGACIGQRGGRITTIIEELGGEKIDIIQWSENTEEYIKHALSPAKVKSVELKGKPEDADKEASVTVPADQFSLAIGRGGQNVRLAAQLTGWKINVVSEAGDAVLSSDAVPEDAEAPVAEVAPDAEAAPVEEVKAE